MTRKRTTLVRSPSTDYGDVLADVVGLVDAARRGAVRSVNAIMTPTYWAIGRRIVEQEQRGAAKAGYGDELMVRLSRDLQARFGRGFGRANLSQMRAFYWAYREIFRTASGESPSVAGPQKVQTVSGQLAGHDDVAVVANRLPLPWSQYVRLMAVRYPEARRFYETEALRGGWTIRQLDRQIGSQFYERTINYARKHWTLPGENPPIGLILCAVKNHAVAQYALEGLPNKVLAAEYRTALPDERLLVQAIEKTRRQLETRGGSRPKAR